MIELNTVKGFEKYKGYFVSKDGRVFSNKSGGMLEMVQADTPNRNGSFYKRIGLTDGKTRKTFRVHRLVLLCYKYVENYEELTGHHIDEDTCNNHIDNLSWETVGDNIRISQSGSDTFEDPDFITAAYLSTDITLQELADKYNCSLETMWRTVNVYSTLKNTKKRRTFNKEAKRIIAESYLEGRTLKQVSELYNCSQSLVSLSVKLYKRGDLNEVS